MPKKIAFATRLDPELMDLLRQWAIAERRSLSDQLAVLIEQEHKRRSRRRIRSPLDILSKSGQGHDS